MGKYLVRYLIFWLPAMLAASFLSGGHRAVQAALWLCSAVMLLGWLINTGMAAYHYPYRTLSLLLVYAGFHVLAASVIYSAVYRSRLQLVARAAAGFFSYRPMEPLLNILQAFAVPAELVVVGIVTAFCLIGYVLGVFQRHINPNPYRPRIMRR